MKGRSAGGNLLAKMLPTFKNCLFKMLGIREQKIMIMMIIVVYYMHTLSHLNLVS